MRTPLKSAPLRQAGQSLREAQNELIDKLEEIVLAPFILFIVALYEWIAYSLSLPRKPWILTLTVMGFVGYAIWRIRPLRNELKNLRKGEEAERVVAEQLEKIGTKLGMHAYHDLQGEGFNLDHILIGRKGVFCIETKYRSKPDRGQTVIEYDGNELRINGDSQETQPLIQSKAQARYLREILPGFDETKLWVQPIVLFPGWYVRATIKPSARSVLVLNPDQLEGYLSRLPDQIESVRLDGMRWAIETQLRK